jgi:hypothetical protein
LKGSFCCGINSGSLAHEGNSAFAATITSARTGYAVCTSHVAAVCFQGTSTFISPQHSQVMTGIIAEM